MRGAGVSATRGPLGFPALRPQGLAGYKVAPMNPLPASRAHWLARHVLPHEASLRAWLRRSRELPMEVDDLIQEAYAVLAGLDSVEHITNPRAYFFQTARSIALQQLRRDRIVSIEAIADIEDIAEASYAASTEDQVAGREELRRLADAIAALPPQCGEVFRLRKIEGLSQRDVARHMGLAESTVEKHMGKAIRILMDVFGRGGKSAVRASRPAVELDDNGHGHGQGAQQPDR